MNSSQQSSVTSHTKTAVIALLSAALVGACADNSELWSEQRRFAMGTWVDTVYRAPDTATRTAIDAEVDQLLARYEIDYYAWADGELGRLNAALARGERFVASNELAALLARAQALSHASDRFFDPGVGALVAAWGFNSSDIDPTEPAAEFLNEWRRSHPSLNDLQIDGRTLSSPSPALVIDLGGIAKGEIIDRILDRFAAAGINDALVNAGGDVRVIGRRGERSWSIGIQSPRAEELLGAVALHNGEAAFTSGDYERFFETDAGRSHHLLNPMTGHPATHTRAVTVIADNGALADAAATAIFIAGPNRWRAVATALGITMALRVDAGGDIQMTQAMRERVRMQATVEPATIPVTP